MKTKRSLFFVIMSALMVVVLSFFAFSCKKKDNTVIEIDSATEITLEIGEEYKLIYTCAGGVTVTVSGGGTYNAETQVYTATEAGSWVLTVTGEESGKNPTSKTVSITVNQAADRTRLEAAIARADGLVQSDYTTTSWNTMIVAKNQAKATTTGSQSVVDGVAQELENAINELEAVALVKATATADQITYRTSTYYAEDYENLGGLKAEIDALNANSEITLNSKYKAEFDKIVDKLIAKPTLTVVGAPNGKMLVSELKSIKMTADTDADDIVWTINGEKRSEDTECNFTPAFNTEYTIEVTVTKDVNGTETTRTRTFSGSFQKATYEVNPNVKGITVEDNVVKVDNMGISWDTEKGKKVEISDLVFYGDVTVYFDVSYEGTLTDNAVLGLFFNSVSGNDQSYAIVNFHCNDMSSASVIESSNGNGKTHTIVSFKAGETYHIKAERKIVDGKGYVTIWYLDDNGRVLAEAVAENSSNYIGGVKLGVQVEQIKGTLSNLSVECESIFDKTALTDAIRECVLEYAEEDYDANLLRAYKDALNDAKTMLASATTDNEVTSAASELRKAYGNLKLKSLELAVIANGDIIFNGTTYNHELYDADSFTHVVESIQAISTEGLSQSQYNKQVQDLIDTLKVEVPLSIEASVTEGKHVVSTLPGAQTFKAEVVDGTEVTWYVNGNEATEGVSEDGLTLTVTPEFGVEYTVKAEAENAGKRAIPVEHTFSYVQVVYKENDVDHIDFEGDVIKVVKDNNGGTAKWPNNEGNKVVLSGIALTGNVTVSFDFKFNTIDVNDNEDPNVILGIFLLNLNGNRFNDNNYVVVNPIRNGENNAHDGNGILEVSDGGNRKQATEKIKAGETYTVKFTRTVNGNSATLNAWIYNADGVCIATNAVNKSTKADNFTIGIQAENCTGEISNFVIENGATVLNYVELDKAIAATANDYKEGDFSGLDEYNEALDTAKDLYTKREAAQAEIDKAANDLKAAFANVKKIAVVPANAILDEDEETVIGFTYNGEKYLKEDYTNFDVIYAQIKEIDVDEDTLVSEYDNDINGYLRELKLSLEAMIEGAPKGAYVVDSFDGIEFTLTATVVNGSISWKIGKADVTAGSTSTDAETNVTTSTIKFAPTEYGEYTISVTATRGTKTNTKSIVTTFIKPEYSANISASRFNADYRDKVTVDENNVLTVNGAGWEWTDEKGQKAYLSNVILSGEFEATMDVTYTSNLNKIMGIFLLDSRGNHFHDDNWDRAYYVVAHGGDKFVGVGTDKGGGEDKEYVANNMVNGETFTLKVARYFEDGKWYLKGEITVNGETKSLVRDNCIADDVILGVQSEDSQFKIGNLKLSCDAVKTESIVGATANCLRLDKTINLDLLNENFGDKDVNTEYARARQAVFDAYYDFRGHTDADVKDAIKKFNAAYEALLGTKIDLTDDECDVMAKVGTDAFTYNGNEYTALVYKNFATISAKVSELNATVTADMFVSDYNAAIKEIIAELEYALEIKLTATDKEENAVEDNTVYLSAQDKVGEGEDAKLEDKVFTFNASAILGTENSTANADKFSFQWLVDGKEIADATSATYVYTASKGTHLITVKVTYTTEDGEKIPLSESFTLAFTSVNANIYQDYNAETHAGVKVNADGSFSTNGTGTNWGNWEGRKIVFNELVFNGSFSVSYDFTINAFNNNDRHSGGHVLTIDVLNADTLSRDNTRDNAVIGFADVCFNRDFFELSYDGNHAGMGEKDYSDERAQAISNFAAVGVNATLKMYVYKDNDGHINLAVELTFHNVEVSEGVYEDKVLTCSTAYWDNRAYTNGFIVGVNIENVDVTISNFQFELLEAGNYKARDYVAGSVKSKANLYNAYVEYAKVDASQYVNGDKFMAAYKAAYSELCDNTVNADYATAYNNLVAAYKALKLREVFVAGLDNGYDNYRGLDKFTAVLPEGATNVKWTYNFNGAEDATTVEGAVLTLEAGAYTNVTLSYELNDETVTVNYQNFVANDVTYTTSNVTVNEDGSITVDQGGDYMDTTRLVLDGQLDEFEFSFDMKYTGDNVMAIKLFAGNGGNQDNDKNRFIEAVVRFNQNGGQIGFDQDRDWGYVGGFGGFTVGETYTFKFNVWKDVKKESGKDEYHLIFSVYYKGELLASKESEKTYSKASFEGAQIRFAFENAKGVLSNFVLMYNEYKATDDSNN